MSSLSKRNIFRRITRVVAAGDRDGNWICLQLALGNRCIYQESTHFVRGSITVQR